MALLLQLANGFNLERVRTEFSSISTSIQKLKPPQDFFDFSRVSKPANFNDVQSRIGYNLGYYSANYIAIVLILSIYALITNLLLLFVIFFIIGGVLAISKVSELSTPFGTYSQSQLYSTLLIISIPLAFFASPISTLMWLIGSSLVTVLSHASLMEKPIETVFEEEV